MATVFNSPVLQYVVETRNPQHELLLYFKIEQAVSGGDCERSRQRIRNQVEAHLSDLGSRTGLRYCILFEGDCTRLKAFCRQFNIELS